MKKNIINFTLVILFLLLSSLVPHYYNIYETNKQETIRINEENNKLIEIGYNTKEIEILRNNLEDIKILYNYKYLNNLTNLINNENYNKDNLKLYLNYLNKDKTIEEIITYTTEPIVNITKCKYYIESKLDNYIEYYNNHKDLSYDEIILRINSNIDKQFYTNTKKTDLSKEYLILVNKYNYLDPNYKVNLVYSGAGYGDLEVNVQKEYIKMRNDGLKAGVDLYSVSAYRDYYTQKYIYENKVKYAGQINADKYSARPGHSEHQTGLALDLNTAETKDHFENTKEYAWLMENSKNYGFILRYPKGKEYITGYSYEPWHFRYVGKEAATYIMDNNITFEEYYAYFVDNK